MVNLYLLNDIILIKENLKYLKTWKNQWVVKKDDVTFKYCLRYTLKIEDHFYNIYFHLCHISLIIVIDGYIGDHFFGYWSIHLM